MLAQEQRGARTRGRAQRALFAVLFLALLVLLPSSSAAQVITFSSASASWRDAQDNVPGSQPGDAVITNGVPTSSISWGGRTPPYPYSGTVNPSARRNAFSVTIPDWDIPCQNIPLSS